MTEEKDLTMDELITSLGDILASIEGKGRDICQAAVNILFALSEEGARTTDEALDVLHDYRLQAKQDTILLRKHLIAGRPFLKSGMWHCPDCRRRVTPRHYFCYNCGKKLGWR